MSRAALVGLLAGLSFVLAFAAMPAPVWAQLVPANLRAAIFIRALGYERTFTSARTPAKLIVVKGASGEAAQDGSGMTRAFRELVRAGGISRPVTVSELTMRDVDGTARQLQAAAPTVVYLPQGAYEIGERLASSRGLVVLCASARSMDRGCTLSVELSGRSPRLVVNLARANRAGLRFDARLLGLSRVIR